jgi:hypothetical protein
MNLKILWNNVNFLNLLKLIHDQGEKKSRMGFIY